LIKQYIVLLKTENVTIEFTKDAIQEIASMAFKVNQETENIGARRLYTVVEKMLEDISYRNQFEFNFSWRERSAVDDPFF